LHLLLWERTLSPSGHLNLCELEHLAHILPIKNVSQICDFPWCNLKVSQLCYLLHFNSHTGCKVQIISVLAHHITSCSVANSQRFASHLWLPEKREVWHLFENLM
jgi:hypothetical protein